MHDHTPASLAGGATTVDPIKALHQVPRLRNALRLAALLGLYTVLAVTALAFGPWAVLAVAPVMGIILAGLLNVAHDCVHLRFSGDKRLDAWLGRWLCAPLLINFPDFRHAHLKHHQHARTAADTEWTGTFTSRAHYLRYLLLANPLRGQLRVWRPADGDVPGRTAVRGAQVGLLVVAVLAPGATAVCWLLPFVMGHVFIRFFSLPEHYGLAAHRDVERMTRSVRSLPALRFLLWEASFHAEHHRWPGVPSLNLPALHALGALPPANLSLGYVQFHYELFKSLPVRHGP